MSSAMTKRVLRAISAGKIFYQRPSEKTNAILERSTEI